MEVSEEMCADKLQTCSNLYGGGEQGKNLLIATMTSITDETISQSCPDLLTAFAKKRCTVPDKDSKHSYPYGCRKYTPGESRYAQVEIWNINRVNPFARSEILTEYSVDNSLSIYTNMCQRYNYTQRYLTCKVNYYLWCENATDGNGNNNIQIGEGNDFFCKNTATRCAPCPATYSCMGGKEVPQQIQQDMYNTCDGEIFLFLVK